MSEAETSGCDECFPASAEPAARARSALAEIAVLVDESHHRVRGDPQHWSLLQSWRRLP